MSNPDKFSHDLQLLADAVRGFTITLNQLVREYKERMGDVQSQLQSALRDVQNLVRSSKGYTSSTKEWVKSVELTSEKFEKYFKTGKREEEEFAEVSDPDEIDATLKTHEMELEEKESVLLFRLEKVYDLIKLFKTDLEAGSSKAVTDTQKITEQVQIIKDSHESAKRKHFEDLAVEAETLKRRCQYFRKPVSVASEEVINIMSTSSEEGVDEEMSS